MSILATMGTLINFALDLYLWLILGRVLLSWVNPDPYNPIVIFLARTTEPALAFFRRWIPPLGMIDLSPVWALLAIQLLQRLITALTNPMATAEGALLGFAMELVYLVHILMTLYFLLLLLRFGMNIHAWRQFRQGRRTTFNLYNPGIRFLFTVTEAMLRPMRLWFPTYRGLDLTPVLAAGLVLSLLLLVQEGVTLLMEPGMMFRP